MTDRGAKSPSSETTLLESPKMTEMNFASWFMKRVRAASTVQLEDETAESVPDTACDDVEC